MTNSLSGFLSWRFRRAALIGLGSFLLGFLTSWLIWADTLRYVLEMVNPR